MKRAACLLATALLLSLAACSPQPPAPAPDNTSAAANSPAASSTTAAPTTSPATNASAPATATAPSAGESADDNPAVAGSNSALERMAQLPAAVQLPAGKWIAGTHYKPLVPAQPTQVSGGKVEVVEVFWYGCSHCNALEPFIASWLKTKPSYVEFVRVHVTWSAIHRAHARLYYTLEALGKLDQLHAKVFDEIHNKHNLLAGNDEAESLAAQISFARANGINGDAFANTWRSFGVESQLQRADDLVRRYRVEGVPLVVVNGKYITDVGMAGGQAKLIELINDLAASEKRR